MTNPAAGWTGTDVDGAGIDMYPAPAEQMMRDIAKVVTDAKSRWASADGKIQGLEGRIGNGPLGRPVAKQYNPTAKQIREFVEMMLKRSQKLSDAGTRAVPIYVTADNLAGQHFEF